ncbi:hypothetical protein EMIT0P201_50366 [Pseudomonas chlororaphis]
MTSASWRLRHSREPIWPSSHCCSMSSQLGSAKRWRTLSITSVRVMVPSKSHTICQCIICSYLLERSALCACQALEQGLCQLPSAQAGWALRGKKAFGGVAGATNFVARYKQHQCLQGRGGVVIDARIFTPGNPRHVQLHTLRPACRPAVAGGCLRGFRRGGGPGWIGRFAGPGHRLPAP